MCILKMPRTSRYPNMHFVALSEGRGSFRAFVRDVGVVTTVVRACAIRNQMADRRSQSKLHTPDNRTVARDAAAGRSPKRMYFALPFSRFCLEIEMGKETATVPILRRKWMVLANHTCNFVKERGKCSKNRHDGLKLVGPIVGKEHTVS